MGHEFIGVVEDIGADVSTLKRGDLVVAPFVCSDNTCDFCAEGLHTSCRNGGDGARGISTPPRRGGPCSAGSRHIGQAVGRGGFGSHAVAADAVGRVRHRLPRCGHARVTRALGHRDRRRRGRPVAVLSAKRLGAEQIILMGRHTARTDLGREFGATDVVAERGEEGIERSAS